MHLSLSLYIEVWGSELALVAIPRNREIGFVSFLFSFRACRACERAGEAKLCERMSDDVLIAGAPGCEFPCGYGQLALISCVQACGF